MGCATKIMPDNTKLRVNGTWWHSILAVGPQIAIGPTGFAGWCQMKGIANIRLAREPTFQFRGGRGGFQSQPVGQKLYRDAIGRIGHQSIQYRQRCARPKGHSLKGFGTSRGDPGRQFR